MKLTVLALFLLLTGLGSVLAWHKPLWNDEFYSQTSVIEEFSFLRLLSGNVPEGNNGPLFYLLQKALTQITGYHTPAAWQGDTAAWTDDRWTDRLVLRIQPVVATSLGMSLVFYFFARFYSLPAGILSLFLSLTSAMSWRYGAEARPYALWVFLSTVQILLFLVILRKKEPSTRVWQGLGMAHTLLALTSVLSALQVVWVSVLLWSVSARKPRQYILMTLLPLAITLWYSARAPKMAFWLEFSVEQYIRAGISRDRLYIMLIYLFAVGIYGLQKKRLLPLVFRDSTIRDAVVYLVFMIGMIASVGAVVWAFHLGESPDRQGFPVTERYFIYLVPVGVVGTTLFLTTMWRALREWAWPRACIFLGMSYLLLHRSLKIMEEIRGFYPELFP